MGRTGSRSRVLIVTPGPGASTRLMLAFLGILALLPLNAFAQRKPKATEWLLSFDRAMADARKQNRLVLAYFSGSDWDPWCQKLDEDVFETEVFRSWAAGHVVLLRIDFPREKRLGGMLVQQNDQLKTRYSVSKTPTIVFLDPSAQPLARAGYDELRRRKDESPGQPRACIEYLDQIVRNRPPEVPIGAQPDFPAALARAKSKYGMFLMMITHGPTARAAQLRDELLHDQQFVKFVNANITFVSITWPDDSDASPAATAFRNFTAKEKIAPVAFQLILYDAAFNLGKARFFAYDPNHVEALIAKIEAQLPHIDYSGGWLTDYNAARTIASQQDRFLFVAFTSMDGGEWSARMDQEIFQSAEFKAYAKKNLVLLKIDFPVAATQPSSATDRMLADLFNIRGFPTIVVVNPLGQKLVDSKYMKGGPAPFLSELDPILRNDALRRTALKD
jgi:thioredoxin-related protein